jgi:hypothetical protein
MRMPQAGEIVMLSDGRKFRLSGVENGPRGWWFTACAVDGSSILQGNLEFAWDPEARVWREERARPLRPSETPLPPSMRSTGAPKHKQPG